MIGSNYSKFMQLLILLGLICFIFLMVFPPSASSAMLPPRYTPTPTPAGDDQDTDTPGKDTPVGAYIQLQAEATPGGLWTVVQWQDSAGNWQTVEGWQGDLDRDGRKTWWVARNDFGKTLFRWAVYQGQGGAFLAATEPFDLPGEAGEMKTVRLALGR